MPLRDRLAGLTLSALLMMLPGAGGAQQPPSTPPQGQPNAGAPQQPPQPPPPRKPPGETQKPTQPPPPRKPGETQKPTQPPPARKPAGEGEKAVPRPPSQKPAEPEKAVPRTPAQKPSTERQKPGARPAPRPRAHPPHPAPAPSVRLRVFIGGYFYDPAFGPYPWWRGPDYQYWYYPVYDERALLRIVVTPEAAKIAAVYVDGFYAGIVDDFDGAFQSLPLTPGGHTIVLYLEGYRTVHRNLYLRPGSTFTLRERFLRLPPGEWSEPPALAPTVPPPPSGSYSLPPTTSAIPPPPATAMAGTPAAGYGTLDLFVQPATADVLIDGQAWLSSEAGHFVVQVSAGTHRVEIRKSGYRRYAADVDVRDGEQTRLNVSLAVSR